MKISEILKSEELYELLADRTSASNIIPVSYEDSVPQWCESFDTCDLFHVTDKNGRVILETGDIHEAIDKFRIHENHS